MRHRCAASPALFAAWDFHGAQASSGPFSSPS